MGGGVPFQGGVPFGWRRTFSTNRPLLSEPMNANPSGRRSSLCRLECLLKIRMFPSASTSTLHDPICRVWSAGVPRSELTTSVRSTPCGDSVKWLVHEHDVASMCVLISSSIKWVSIASRNGKVQVHQFLILADRDSAYPNLFLSHTCVQTLIRTHTP